MSEAAKKVINDDVMLAGSPAEKMSKALAHCFDRFNRELFDERLPKDTMITLGRKNRVRGFYIEKMWNSTNVADSKPFDEICLNPEYFSSRTFEETLSTLVHEMVHQWQHHYGTCPQTPKYHNAEWANKMEALGLMPAKNGTPNGARTGTSISHFIIKGGAFDVCAKDIDEKYRLPFKAVAFIRSNGRRTGYVKHICPNCQALARAGTKTEIACVPCSDEVGAIVKMEAQDLE